MLEKETIHIPALQMEATFTSLLLKHEFDNKKVV